MQSVEMLRVVKLLRTSMDSRPLSTNCLLYGSLAGLAEFSQQALTLKLADEKVNKKPTTTLSRLYLNILLCLERSEIQRQDSGSLHNTRRRSLRSGPSLLVQMA